VLLLNSIVERLASNTFALTRDASGLYGQRRTATVAFAPIVGRGRDAGIAHGVNLVEPNECLTNIDVCDEPAGSNATTSLQALGGRVVFGDGSGFGSCSWVHEVA